MIDLPSIWLHPGPLYRFIRLSSLSFTFYTYENFLQNILFVWIVNRYFACYWRKYYLEGIYRIVNFSAWVIYSYGINRKYKFAKTFTNKMLHLKLRTNSRKVSPHISNSQQRIIGIFFLNFSFSSVGHWIPRVCFYLTETLFKINRLV